MALIPTDDRDLARRLRRQLMGVASYFMFLLPLAYATVNGWMEFGWQGLAAVFVAALAVNAVFFWLIRSGRTAHLRDPSLTFLQIALAMALALYVVAHTEEARGMLMMLFVASLFFGVFGLPRWQLLTLSVAAVVGYTAVVAWQHRHDAWHSDPVRLEGLRLLTLAMMMVWLALLGGYVGSLRLRLERRNAELGAAMAKLRAVASHDELTGVHNRRHLLGVLDKEKERADRFGQTFSVALIDLDHFKQVNDTKGHAAGDDVLRGFAGRMLGFSRKMDWVGRTDAGRTPRGTPARLSAPGAAAAAAAAFADGATGEGGGPGDVPASAFGRYGGEEFLLVLPQTTRAGAVRATERLRERTSSAPFDTVAGPVDVTFSAGVAQYVPGEPVSETLARADGALYEAKANGRNRTEAAG